MFGCNNNRQQATVTNTDQKKLIVPANLKVYAPFDNYVLDSTQIANSALKLYVSINFSCPTCIDKISKWAQLIPQSSAKNNVPVIIIANADDRFELIKYLIKKNSIKKFPYPFFLDQKGEFIALNKVIKESAELNAVLTDKDNNILLQGNPLHFPEVKTLFLKKINAL
jgi:hypothetical protein